MPSSVTSNGNFTFKVGPQPVLRSSSSSKQGKQITFKTDQRQYRQGLSNVLTEQNQSPVIPQSAPYSRNIRFADPKTQTGFTPRQFDPEQPPAKRPKVRYERNRTEPTLSIRKPLKVSIPLDAWQLIFQRCDLAFLLKARLVCRGFRDVLSRQALWRKARIYNHGNGVPNPPKDLTEAQYASLLVVRGCQVKPCTRKDTRKVYWPFMLRMCDKCFDRTTQVPDLNCVEAQLYSEMYASLEYEVRQTIPAQLPGLLPAGGLMSSRWSGPRLLNQEGRNWLEAEMSATAVVLAAKYEALRVDFSNKVQHDSDYFLFWARLKWGETRDRMSKALELERLEIGEASRTPNLREQKIELYREKASKLDPPLDFKLLQKFTAYHNAIDTPNAASLRSWDTLKAKIDVPELRAQAEQLVKWDQITNDRYGTATIERDVYDRVSEHRNSGRFARPRTYKPEQKTVIDIARKEFEEIFDVVHDEDVLLLLFDRVRRVYESLDHKPIGLNIDGTEGPYALMLDDALMLVTDLLQPHLLNLGLRDRYRKILTSLRCVGCTRTNVATTYDFEDLMRHIRKTHAGFVAKDTYWYRMAVPLKHEWARWGSRVAYCGLPWFKTMPALPFHRNPTPGMTWNPDVETEYIQHGGAQSPTVTLGVLVTSQTRIPISDSTSGFDFSSNFCRAATILAETRLSSILVIKVALEYATEVHSLSRDVEASPIKITATQLEGLETMCAKIAARLEFKFQCKKCAKEIVKRQDCHRPTRSRRLPDLLLHWQKKHPVDEDSCFTQHIVVPTESELLTTMEEEDAKLEAEKGSLLRKKTRHNASIDPRTMALLVTPSIRSCFDKLFTQGVNGEDTTRREVDL